MVSRPRVTPKMEYEPGDECWIAVRDEPELVRCTVALKFKTPWHPNFFYNCQIMDDDFMHMEVRDALTMSPTAEGPLPVWKKA
jgi:hypothetical protein